MKNPGLIQVKVLSLLTTLSVAVPAMALPPPEEVPEEILRTEIITEARSPVDGERLSAAEYAELEEELQAGDRVPQLPPSVRQVIFLLQIRRALQQVLPFY